MSLLAVAFPIGKWPKNASFCSKKIALPLLTEAAITEKVPEREKMSVSTTAYLARRAAQKERVQIPYRRALRDTLNWAVHRHLFYQDASNLREKFDAKKHVEDQDAIDRMIAEGEAQYNKWRHPDPYIVPWAPGGSKFTRNPTPPSGIEMIHVLLQKIMSDSHVVFMFIARRQIIDTTRYFTALYLVFSQERKIAIGL
ncbi:NADH dehydrogenase [ubiquinone] 1 beta subcomplex subunit 9 isoform X2 [Manihot esculenta]|uniref:NADH dehydrogenase [ubiquinone] 1 beta subcomplex subunit 9 isoform X2 n=1 Tax=Manihot esculenta TaxID=3983 RepID=UPI000B5D1D27|nr:NADH dehydrogenase [ubiquinone] 1 beta subcomplex subunit 9 isoform X2 [Manihot esculenta]